MQQTTLFLAISLNHADRTKQLQSEKEKWPQFSSPKKERKKKKKQQSQTSKVCMKSLHLHSAETINFHKWKN